MTDTVTVKVRRNNDEVEDPYYESFEVPYEEEMRVLDALKWIQENEDGTLAFRWNCGEGICGSCAMEVNGKPVLTCKHELASSLSGVKIAPLRVSENIKDLVHDNSTFEEKEADVRPWFNGPSPGDDGYTMSDEEAAVAREMRRCIECNICHASCRPIRDDLVDFPGPRTIVTARGWDEHPKDAGGRAEQLDDQGLHNCNKTRCCQINCPKDITITDKAIQPAQDATQNRGKDRPNVSRCDDCDALTVGEDCQRCRLQEHPQERV